MKSKWLKNQIKRWKYSKTHDYLNPRTKREAIENQTIVCMVLFVLIIVGLTVKELIVRGVIF